MISELNNTILECQNEQNNVVICRLFERQKKNNFEKKRGEEAKDKQDKKRKKK